MLFQSVMGTILDIPGKLIPSVLQELESHLDQVRVNFIWVLGWLV